MPGHSYTAQHALDLLMKKLSSRDETLAAQVQAALDAGKDASETEPATDRRKKARVYRKTVPFTREEALQLALDALHGYFVEQPLFVGSAADNLAKSAIGVPRHDLPSWAYSPAATTSEPEPVSLEGKNEEKAYEAYVLGLCLRAARELGVTPVLRGISGAPTRLLSAATPPASTFSPNPARTVERGQLRQPGQSGA